MGIEPKSLMLLTQEGDEIQLVTGEVIPHRRVRQVPTKELAQALMDDATTPEGIADAHEGVRQPGLNPDDFKSKV